MKIDVIPLVMWVGSQAREPIVRSSPNNRLQATAGACRRVGRSPTAPEPGR